MSPRIRKLALTAHVTSSVGWFGAAGAYLAVAILGLTSREPPIVRAAYLATEVIGWFVLVPCSFGSLLTGLVQSLGTEWGLLRHYWVAAKLVSTVFATTILLVHMRTVSRVAAIAADAVPSHEVRTQLVVHAAGGLLVLLTATTLSVYKPWGRTAYGRRHRRAERAESGEPIAGRSWGMYVMAGIAGMVLLVVVLHAAGAVPGH